MGQQLSRFLWIDAMVATEKWTRTCVRDKAIYGQYVPACTDWKNSLELCKIQELVVAGDGSLFYIVMTPDRRERFVEKRDIVICKNGKRAFPYKKNLIRSKITTGGVDRACVVFIDGVFWERGRELGRLGDKGITNIIHKAMGRTVVKDSKGKEMIEAFTSVYDRNGNFTGTQRELLPKPTLYVATPSKKCQPSKLNPLFLLTEEV